MAQILLLDGDACLWNVLCDVLELTFRTLFRAFAAIFEEPPVEGGSGAIARRSHAP